MIISSSFTYSKRIVLDAIRLNKLECILLKFCNTFFIQATTIGGSSITFDSFEELKGHDNFQKGRLRKLNIRANNGNGPKAEVDIAFTSRAGSESVYCSYRFDDSDKKTIFLNDIQTFLEKAKEANRVGYVGDWISLFVIVSLCYIALDKFQLTTSYMDYVYGSVIPVCLYFLYSRLIWYKLFPMVSFAWGESEKYYDNIKKIRSSLFWSVIVALVIGILVNLF